MSSKIRGLGPLLGLALALVGAEAAQGQSLFDFLFGPPPARPPAVAPAAPWGEPFGGSARRARPTRHVGNPDGATSHATARSGTGYRTLCVRSCDGYYWPISYSTSPSRFEADEAACKASCPGQKVALYTHRAADQWSDDAVSRDDEPLAKLKKAFLYRQEFKPECKCRAPQSLVAEHRDARRHVTPIRAVLSASDRAPTRPHRVPATDVTGSARKDAGQSAEPVQATPAPEAKRNVRVVGPPFLAD